MSELIQINVTLPIKARTVLGAAFLDGCGRGYDVELFDDIDVAKARIAEYAEQGIKAKIAEVR